MGHWALINSSASSAPVFPLNFENLYMAGYPGSQLAFEDEELRVIGCISTIVGIAGSIPAPAFKGLDNTERLYSTYCIEQKNISPGRCLMLW